MFCVFGDTRWQGPGRGGSGLAAHAPQRPAVPTFTRISVSKVEASLPRNRIPKARALIEGRDLVHPERHRNRNEPTSAPLGKAPKWMTPAQADVWRTFEGEAPWLNYSHRGLVEISSVVRARLASGEDVGMQAMGLLRLCLGSMGLTPADASKVAWAPEEPEDDLLD
jgi:hypothetical protein